jgi:predicted N-acyltransferase
MKILFIVIFTCLFFSNTFSQAPVFALPSNTFFMKGAQGFVKVKNGYLGVRKYGQYHKNIHKPHLNRLNVSVVNYDDRIE